MATRVMAMATAMAPTWGMVIVMRLVDIEEGKGEGDKGGKGNGDGDEGGG
jgi:hypothetical protein